MKDFFGNESLYKLNKYLSKIETTCFVKLHPMDYMDINNFEGYSNIILLMNLILFKKALHYIQYWDQ